MTGTGIAGELERTERSISALRTGICENGVSHFCVSPADCASTEEELRRDAALLDVEGKVAHRLRVASEREDNGGNGECICGQCGCEIGAERLEALPGVETCIACQAELEQNGH